jgi:adenosylhomocysteine nucleosidase
VTQSEGLRWVIALPSEANPIIEHYKLHLVCDRPFKLYADKERNQGLVISGIGRSASAAATVFIAERMPSNSALVFINVGIAGAAQLELGTVWRAHKVSARSTGKVWYPGAMKFKECGSAGLTTVEKPELKYPGDDLFDMEAAGFFEMASKFSPLELVQSLKIISDNSQEDIQAIDKHRVKKWISDAMGVVDSFQCELIKIRDAGSDKLPPPEWEETITATFRFSVTQSHQLRTLVMRYWAMRESPEPLLSFLTESQGSKQYLKRLSDYVSTLPVEWGER